MGDSAQGMGLMLVPVEAPGQDAFGQVFTTMMKERMEAFVILGDAVLFNYRGQIAEMAMRNRLPAVSGFKEIAEAGLLLTYGANVRDLFRRSAIFVDKILKGAKPTDLPVEQPTKFELVVNLNTVKALDVVVPPSLLLRADEVIENSSANRCGAQVWSLHFRRPS
jgi:putative ABC transport system substrate-binding protein